MKDERCKDCYYWDRENSRIENNRRMASCLFDAPRVFMFDLGRVVTARPQTPETGRCGKFKKDAA